MIYFAESPEGSHMLQDDSGVKPFVRQEKRCPGGCASRYP